MIYKYHDIKPTLADCRSKFNLDLPTFEQHCKSYKKTDLLVFDDGDITQMAALPILHKYGLKAMFMIIAGNIGKPEYFGEQEIKQIVSEGFQIGNHTYNHRDLTTLSKEQLMLEIVLCSIHLKKFAPVEYFSPPFEIINQDAKYICNILELKLIENHKTIINGNFGS